MFCSKLYGFLMLIVVIQAQKIPVNIYYESLCPDSQKFITEQVYPAMKNGLNQTVNINWIPFGKAKVESQGSEFIFECHHGPNECYGNKVQACGIKNIQVNSYQQENTRESLILEFINCLMRAGKNFPDNVYPGKKCAESIGFNHWSTIEQCANSTEGSKLVKEFGDMTKQFQNPLISVPSFTINNKSPENLSAALMDFTTTVCKEISSPHPQICSERNTATVIILPTFTALIVSVILRLFF